MFKKINKKTLSSLFILGTLFLFSGCAKDNLLIKSYSPPEEMDKVKEIMAKTTSNESYLDVYIHDNRKDIKAILNNKTRDRSVAQTLVANVKNYLTESNFIGINQNENSNTISLEMKIINYSYKRNSNNIDAFLEVSFSFIKDENAKPIFTPIYEASEKRSSASGRQGLPSKSEILSSLAKDIALSLVMDISPIKERKLVELKSLPDELAYTISYAKLKNFKGAIKAMNKYKGEKTLEYYFDLAIYYEALASRSSNLDLLENANENYEKAMALGGFKDEVVIKTKAKFDNFYDLIKMIDKQKKANKKATSNEDDEVL